MASTFGVILYCAYCSSTAIETYRGCDVIQILVCLFYNLSNHGRGLGSNRAAYPFIYLVNHLQLLGVIHYTKCDSLALNIPQSIFMKFYSEFLQVGKCTVASDDPYNTITD